MNKNIEIEKALLVLFTLFILTSSVYTHAQVSCSANGVVCANGVTIILTRIEELNKSIENCQTELSRLTRPYLVPSKESLRTKIMDLIGLFEKSNYEKKRQILKMFVKQIVLDPFNKCVVVEGYCDPLCTWTEKGKLNKKASDCSEAHDFASVQVGCGGWI